MVDNNNLKFIGPLIYKSAIVPSDIRAFLLCFPSRRMLRSRHAKHGSFEKPERREKVRRIPDVGCLPSIVPIMLLQVLVLVVVVGVVVGGARSVGKVALAVSVAVVPPPCP